jgi:hypothetical protein
MPADQQSDLTSRWTPHALLRGIIRHCGKSSVCSCAAGSAGGATGCDGLPAPGPVQLAVEARETGCVLPCGLLRPDITEEVMHDTTDFGAVRVLALCVFGHNPPDCQPLALLCTG